MKKIFNFMQGTGFTLFMLGVLACDTSLTVCIIMVLAGLAIALGFAALENQFYFCEREKGNEKSIKHPAYHNTSYPSYLYRS